MSVIGATTSSKEAGLGGTGSVAMSLARAADFLLAREPQWVIPLLPLIFVQNTHSSPALAAAILPWLLRLVRRGHLTQRTPFDPAMALVLLGATVGHFTSADRSASLEGLQSYVAALLAFYLVVNHPHHLRLYLSCLFAAAAAAVVWVFSQGSVSLNKYTLFGDWIYRLAAPLPKVTDLPAYPNGLACFLAVAVPIASGLAVYSSRPRRRLLCGTVALSLALAALLTGSRGGLIGLAVALIFVVSWRTRWTLLGLPGLAALLLLLAVGRLPALDGLWANPWSSSAGGRLAIWRGTLEILPDRFLTGTGPGAGVSFYALHVPPWLAEFATNPHNALLQLWSDAGLLGLAAAAVALFAGLRLARNLRSMPRGHGHFGLAVGLLGAVIGGAVHGTFESAISGVIVAAPNLYHYVVSPLPWVLAGLLWVVLSPFALRQSAPERS